MEPLNAEVMAAALTTRWLGRPAVYLPSVGSTNDYMWEWVATGTAKDPPHGALALADFQSDGKGRFNRRWQAPPESSLLFSLLFRPEWPAERANWLMMMAGVAAAEAIVQVTGLPAALKWPNDVVLPHGAGWAKVSGTLLELGLAGDRLEYVILGMGLNVNISPAWLPQLTLEWARPIAATSLLAELGRPVSRLALLRSLLSRLEALYEAAAAGQSPQAAWNERLMVLGRPVRLTGWGDGKVLVGVAEETDEWGRLLIRDEDGRAHVVAAGDVSLRV